MSATSLYILHRSQLTTRQEVESISLLLSLGILDHYSMTGIVSPGTPRADIRISSENVDKFPLAFVAPLGTETARSVLREGFDGASDPDDGKVNIHYGDPSGRDL